MIVAAGAGPARAQSAGGISVFGPDGLGLLVEEGGVAWIVGGVGEVGPVAHEDALELLGVVVAGLVEGITSFGQYAVDNQAIRTDRGIRQLTNGGQDVRVAGRAPEFQSGTDRQALVVAPHVLPVVAAGVREAVVDQAAGVDHAAAREPAPSPA